GIVAIEALRYGAVPIVRRTGGLSDIVTDFAPETMTGNGFVFKKPSSWALFAAVVRGIQLYHVPHVWKKLIENAMAGNFSWDKAAVEYENLYKRVLKLRRKSI
ncbi:starch synthase, partial [Microgenomates group bacterium]|nr:starch synthase [Microgenomates group bacterium]